MARQAQAPVGSRWVSKTETKDRVFVVLERKAFGRIEIMQEGRARFGSTTLKALLADFNRLPGLTE